MKPCALHDLPMAGWSLYDCQRDRDLLSPTVSLELHRDLVARRMVVEDGEEIISRVDHRAFDFRNDVA